jgi:hypothetical protein
MIIISLFVIGQMSAQWAESDMQNRTENWLKPEKVNSSAGGGYIGNETPTGDPSVPIGDVPLWSFCLLTAGYIIMIYRKKNKSLIMIKQ